SEHLFLCHSFVIEKRCLSQLLEPVRFLSRVALQLVDGDVERVEEATVARGKGTAAPRLCQEKGVQRVDPDEIGPLVGSKLTKLSQILETADSPVAARTQTIELAGSAPYTALLEKARQVTEAAGRGLGLRRPRGRQLLRCRRACSREDIDQGAQRGPRRVHPLAIDTLVATDDAIGGRLPLKVRCHRRRPRACATSAPRSRPEVRHAATDPLQSRGCRRAACRIA